MRLFVAVWPSDDVVDALRRLPRPDVPGDGVRWTTPEQWHVTLQFLGNVPDDRLEAITAEWQAVAAARAPRTVHAGPATHCFGRSVLVLPVDGLDDVGRGDPFTGHLTLARSRHRNLRPLAGEPFDASWRVDELTLVRSHTKPEGAVYEVIERWPLGGGTLAEIVPEEW